MLDIFAFDKEVRRISWAEIGSSTYKKIWIDATTLTESEKEVLKEKFKIHSLTMEDITSKNTRIKVEEFDVYLFCVFYGIAKTRRIEFREIDFILGKNFLITHHKKEHESISKIKDDAQKLKKMFERGVDRIFQGILDREVEGYFPLMEGVGDDIEKIQEEITKESSSNVITKVLEMKKRISHIRKIVFQQREKISFLSKNEYAFIAKKSLPFFRDTYDQAIRVHEVVEGHRESAANNFDMYMSTVSNNMNEVMKTLSIIATIALPLSVISGIYGTNFVVLPGQHVSFGFWVMIAVMIIMAALMLFYFKKKNWF